MKCNLIIELNELTVRDYSIIEEEGILASMNNYAQLSFSYEEDEESASKYVLIIKGPVLTPLLSFISFIELPVIIIYPTTVSRKKKPE
jgi:hypothetical protein